MYYTSVSAVVLLCPTTTFYNFFFLKNKTDFMRILAYKDSSSSTPLSLRAIIQFSISPRICGSLFVLHKIQFPFSFLFFFCQPPFFILMLYKILLFVIYLFCWWVIFRFDEICLNFLIFVNLLLCITLYLLFHIYIFLFLLFFIYS